MLTFQLYFYTRREQRRKGAKIEIQNPIDEGGNVQGDQSFDNLHYISLGVEGGADDYENCRDILIQEDALAIRGGVQHDIDGLDDGHHDNGERGDISIETVAAMREEEPPYHQFRHLPIKALK